VLVGLTAMLEGRWFAATTLLDPRRFWETLEDTLPDMLVLDVDLPGMSGIDLCRVVRNEPRWSELPVLFLTVKTDTRTLVQVFAAGGDDYVSKPIVEPELIARMTGGLERAQIAVSAGDTDP
jgi:DNA-binding response OmpR family regulator